MPPWIPFWPNYNDFRAYIYTNMFAFMCEWSCWWWMQFWLVRMWLFRAEPQWGWALQCDCGYCCGYIMGAVVQWIRSRLLHELKLMWSNFLTCWAPRRYGRSCGEHGRKLVQKKAREEIWRDEGAEREDMVRKAQDTWSMTWAARSEAAPFRHPWPWNRKVGFLPLWIRGVEN